MERKRNSIFQLRGVKGAVLRLECKARPEGFARMNKFEKPNLANYLSLDERINFLESQIERLCIQIESNQFTEKQMEIKDQLLKNYEIAISTLTNKVRKYQPQ